MAMVIRILGLALLREVLGAGLGLAGSAPDRGGIAFVLGCVGTMVGAIAGATREAVAALQKKPSL